MSELKHEKVTEAIIGSAMKVLNVLGPGLCEKIYERALVIELRGQGHVVEQQRSFDVFYENRHVGSLVPDLLVDTCVIVDPKVITTFTQSDIAQMLGYLHITGFQVAILLNFSKATLQWKRVVV